MRSKKDFLAMCRLCRNIRKKHFLKSQLDFVQYVPHPEVGSNDVQMLVHLSSMVTAHD